MKPRANITRSSKQGYQWTHKKDVIYLKIKDKINSIVHLYIPVFDERVTVFVPERDADHTGEVHGYDPLYVQFHHQPVL